jgi:hypothetical protein
LQRDGQSSQDSPAGSGVALDSGGHLPAVVVVWSAGDRRGRTLGNAPVARSRRDAKTQIPKGA